MDHAVWAVTPPRIQTNNPLDVAFPLQRSVESFKKWIGERKKWYCLTVTKVFEAQQPYQADAELHPLHVLQHFSNTDKHKLSNLATNNAVRMAKVGVSPAPTGGVKSECMRESSRRARSSLL